MRALILEADPAMTEEWKWRASCLVHDGMSAPGEYAKVVKLTFALGRAFRTIASVQFQPEGTPDGLSTSTKGRTSMGAR